MPERGLALYTIPAHRAFADALVAGLMKRFGDDPMRLARGIVLVPNNRGRRAIQEAFVRASGGGLLLLVPLARANNHGGQGDFNLDAHGRITGRRKPGRLAPFVYTGVQILSPRVIADWPEGPFSTNLFWSRAIESGRAFGLVHQGLWFDVGTPSAIGKTEALLVDA